MAKDKEEKKDVIPGEEETTNVPTSLLEELLKKVSNLENQAEDNAAKTAGLEELLNKPAEEGLPNKLREKRNFEPTFHTVRITQYPMGGDHTKLGYVVGWTNRGSYQEVDRSGVSPQYVDFIDVIFLDNERDADGKLKAERIKTMDLKTNGVQVKCRIKSVNRQEIKVPTGEEIDVTVFDPTHGMMSTGDIIDGFWVKSDIVYTIEIPGRVEPVEIDATYVN